MMLNIPKIYLDSNEEYITLPAIKKFIKTSIPRKLKVSGLKEELIASIISFGQESDENGEIVLNWIDEVIQEGIKDIYLQYSELKSEMELIFREDEKIKAYIKAYVSPDCNKHICNNQYDEDFKLINAELTTGNLGRKIKLVYCKKLHMHDKKHMQTKVIDYPIVAEYYVDKNWLLVRAKPRSNLYVYNPDGFKVDGDNASESTTTDKQITEIIDTVKNLLGLEKYDRKAISSILKKKVFILLDKYSCTPIEIKSKMEEKSSETEMISKTIKEICSVPDNMSQDVEDDIKNIIEKYLSVNWPDKKVFIKDREAYPVKLSATDEEESKVEQTAALDQPLQTKALFFDNKKMLYKNQSCDGVVFQWKRIDQEYFFDETFPVRISVNNKGACIFNFRKYTAKEDIENVIFSVIGVKEDTDS